MKLMLAVDELDRARAQARHRAHVVTHEEHRAAVAGSDFLHLAEAALLELRVAHRQDFVDDEQLGLEVRRDREGEPHVHTRRVPLHRRVEEAFDLGEAARCRRTSRRSRPSSCRGSRRSGRCSHGPTAPGGIRCRPRAATPRAAHAGLADGRLGDARQHLQQRRLAGAVAPDDADHLARLDLERDVAQRPERVVGGILLAQLVEAPPAAPSRTLTIMSRKVSCRCRRPRPGGTACRCRRR